MPTPLPPITDFTAATVTEGGFKAALGDLRGYLAGLLGTDGAVATALASLGALGARHLAVSAAYTVSAADRGRVIEATGSWTLSLPPVADVGPGFAFAATNHGAGTVTIAPAGAETVAGQATLDLRPGRGCALVSSAAGWVVLGPTPDRLLMNDDVQTSATDVTAGRLMRADFGYCPGNLLGAVSQAAGTPTGAVIERGANANGEYLRLADGTQICTAQLTAVYDTASKLRAPWTYPAAYIAVPVLTMSMVHGSASLATATIQKILPPQPGFAQKTKTAAIIGAIDGLATFDPADTIDCHMLAIGRWF